MTSHNQRIFHRGINFALENPDEARRLVAKETSPIRASSPILQELFTFHDESGLTILELAARGGYPDRSIMNWRSGHYRPKIHDVEILGQVLGYKLQWVKL
jgi:hypothetical protein